VGLALHYTLPNPRDIFFLCVRATPPEWSTAKGFSGAASLTKLTQAASASNHQAHSPGHPLHLCPDKRRHSPCIPSVESLSGTSTRTARTCPRRGPGSTDNGPAPPVRSAAAAGRTGFPRPCGAVRRGRPSVIPGRRRERASIDRCRDPPCLCFGAGQVRARPPLH
jgi:hypothetical protein